MLHQLTRKTKNTLTLTCCIVFCWLIVSTSLAQQENPLDTKIDWPAFMARQDPIWKTLPNRWFDAPFLGNGQLGTLIRRINDHQVRWDVGHSFVHDHRKIDDEDYQLRSPEILLNGRLPIGHFILHTQGKITQGSCRLDLWNAEAHGTIHTDKGKIKWRTLVHSEQMVFLVEIEATEGENAAHFEFIPEKAESSRLTARKKNLPDWFKKKHPANPNPVIQKLDDLTICRQNLSAGGQSSTAWIQQKKKQTTQLWVTVAHTYPKTDADDQALQNLKSTLQAKPNKWITSHRRWWHDYYRQSFVSLPDSRWESFYWIQMFKLACATRADRALIDNQGPWLQPTGWNGTWWNLNIQLSYSPVCTANRLELGKALTSNLSRNFQNLINNVAEPYRHDSAGISRNTSMHDLAGKVGQPGSWPYPNKDVGSEVGNLTWTCHNVYRIYRHSMDNELLQNLLYPLLKRSINYYRHFLQPGPDQRLHLPATHSPEYSNAADANYDLSLIRWGCQTLIELAQLQHIDQDMIPIWQDISQRLTEYPQNENGFMVGKDVGFDRSHRHWSHLLMIYPLHLVTPQNSNEKIIRTSLQRWHSFPGSLAGYSFTGGASFAALLGDGNRALEYLNGFHPYMGASTMYFEGGRLPVMETPLHAAQALHEMLLQSWGDRIRVFPALPNAWKDVTFHHLRTEGAFLISAHRANSQTKWVQIISLAGQPCRLQTDLGKNYTILSPNKIPIHQSQPNVYEFQLPKGQRLILAQPDVNLPLNIIPITSTSKTNPFGLKKP